MNAKQLAEAGRFADDLIAQVGALLAETQQVEAEIREVREDVRRQDRELQEATR